MFPIGRFIGAFIILVGIIIIGYSLFINSSFADFKFFEDDSDRHTTEIPKDTSNENNEDEDLSARSTEEVTSEERTDEVQSEETNNNSFDFTIPDLYNKQVMQQLIDGTYDFNGVKLGSKIKDVRKLWGHEDRQIIKTNSYDKNGSFFYGGDIRVVHLFASNKDTNVADDDLTVKSITMYAAGKEIIADKIPELKDSDVKVYTSDDGGYKSYRIGKHLNVVVTRENGKWLVNNILISNYSL